MMLSVNWSGPKALNCFGSRWCRRAGLNCRPQPYQGCALPLSYGGDEEGAYSEPNAVGKAKIVLTDRRTAFTCGHMSQNPKPDNEKAAREARLAQALRTNLRRRKAASPPTAKPESAAEPDESASD